MQAPVLRQAAPVCDRSGGSSLVRRAMAAHARMPLRRGRCGSRRSSVKVHFPSTRSPPPLDRLAFPLAASVCLICARRQTHCAHLSPPLQHTALRSLPHALSCAVLLLLLLPQPRRAAVPPFSFSFFPVFISSSQATRPCPQWLVSHSLQHACWWPLASPRQKSQLVRF